MARGIHGKERQDFFKLFIVFTSKLKPFSLNQKCFPLCNFHLNLHFYFRKEQKIVFFLEYYFLHRAMSIFYMPESSTDEVDDNQAGENQGQPPETDPKQPSQKVQEEGVQRGWGPYSL